MEIFAVRLRKAMEKSGVKQTELAKTTGIDKSLLSNYLSGNYKAKQKNLFLLAKALNVTEAWLMGYDDTEKAPTTDNGNERLAEFMKLFAKLTEEQQTLIISQIKGILSNQ